MLEVRNFIQGDWCAASSGQESVRHDPARPEQVVVQSPLSGAADVTRAAAAARRAARPWSRTPAPERALLVARTGQLLAARREDLATRITREMGKPRRESLAEVDEVVEVAALAAGEGRRLLGETSPSSRPRGLALCQRRPVGVAGLITPWNFPLAMPAWHLFPGLVCGNTFVLKPALETPGVAQALLQALLDAGLPEGVVNLVCGDGPGAGAALVDCPDLDLLAFTGSTAVGREVGSRCGRRLRAACLELGGKNAQIVLRDADLERAVAGALEGAFGTSGQCCTAASRLIVEEAVLEPFTEQLVARVRELRVGDPMAEATDLGPLATPRGLEKVQRAVRIGCQEDRAELLLGGEVLRPLDCPGGAFFAPTVFGGVTSAMRLAQDEIFGPVTAIMPVTDLDEALAVANDVEYGLAASIYTRDLDRAMAAVGELEAGLVNVNGPTTFAEVHLPFGGLKASGNGHRQTGRPVLDFYSEWQTVTIDYSGASSGATDPPLRR